MEKDYHVSVYVGVTPKLRQPGFLGHNLICLSWLLQCEQLVTNEFKNKVLQFIIEQSQWKFTNALDILDEIKFRNLAGNSDKDNFFEQINALLYNSTRNIHQITLAAALVHLWEYFEDKEIKVYLHKICIYFSSET